MTKFRDALEDLSNFLEELKIKYELTVLEVRDILDLVKPELPRWNYRGRIPVEEGQK